MFVFFFFKQKTAYELRISDWSSDVCSSDLLVERGHRLVADDLVMVSRRGNDVLIGQAHDRQGHHMEIRGIGIIDIKTLFGIRAIRLQKRVEVVKIGKASCRGRVCPYV